MERRRFQSIRELSMIGGVVLGLSACAQIDNQDQKLIQADLSNRSASTSKNDHSPHVSPENNPDKLFLDYLKNSVRKPEPNNSIKKLILDLERASDYAVSCIFPGGEDYANSEINNGTPSPNRIVFISEVDDRLAMGCIDSKGESVTVFDSNTSNENGIPTIFYNIAKSCFSNSEENLLIMKRDDEEQKINTKCMTYKPDYTQPVGMFKV